MSEDPGDVRVSVGAAIAAEFPQLCFWPDGEFRRLVQAACDGYRKHEEAFLASRGVSAREFGHMVWELSQRGSGR